MDTSYEQLRIVAAKADAMALALRHIRDLARQGLETERKNGIFSDIIIAVDGGLRGGP